LYCSAACCFRWLTPYPCTAQLSILNDTASVQNIPYSNNKVVENVSATGYNKEQAGDVNAAKKHRIKV
jgi:hypothetical protein